MDHVFQAVCLRYLGAIPYSFWLTLRTLLRAAFMLIHLERDWDARCLIVLSLVARNSLQLAGPSPTLTSPGCSGWGQSPSLHFISSPVVCLMILCLNSVQKRDFHDQIVVFPH